jgi:excisionase family DNA binding protein
VTPSNHDLMTPSEVAKVLRVDPKTVTRWAAANKVGSVKTPGGHIRLFRAEIMELMESSTQER